MLAQDMFSLIEPYQTGRLQLDETHSMYWEVSGNPNGRPIVFLHGGPGAGAGPDHRRFFDPRHYRIVVFDQRGAGRSTPLGELTDNTTQHLIADIERLRDHLGIMRWHVFGGSWGSTLSLAYAQAHPERVSALIVRGIFLGSQPEIDWFLYGMGKVFPENWRNFAGAVPESERHDLLAAYRKRLNDPDPKVHLPAARAWSIYEGSCSTLLPNPQTVAAFGEERHALGLSRIEAHYFDNHIFLAENALLDGLNRIRNVPAIIIQGRYDLVCPIATADTLHRAWPEADYLVVPDAGHSAMEPGIRRALVAATERFKGME
ncbi:prolyl aminopeptidase [Pelagibius sp.]|uniref:prolyl aminopeptidase n=1 Tax=Pelagibius sp. TaxID=1931238 RepID=UPI00262FF6BF|nr:prolyl aminopeptidase [Pelagibius sp.]